MAFLPTVLIAFALLQQGSSTTDIPAKYRLAPPGAVVARVNGVDIKASDVEPLLWEWRGFDAIQDLISYQLIKAEAQKQRLDVNDKDIDAAIDDFIKQSSASLPPGKNIDLALLEQGFTRSRLYLRFRTDLLINAIVERSFSPKQLVKVSTMVFRVANEQTSSLADAIKKANDAYDRLKKGEKWEDVLRTTSYDLNAVKINGLLGWRDLAAFPASVRKELEGLKAGEVTKPAQTSNGIQIFRLDVDGLNAKPEELKEMKATYLQGSRAPLLDRLRKEAKIERLYPPLPGLNSQTGGN